MYRAIFFTVVPLFFFSFLYGSQRRQELSAGPGEEPFDVTQHSVPLNQIRHGGLPKDGIPALMDPDFVSARQADLFCWLRTVCWELYDRVLPRPIPSGY